MIGRIHEQVLLGQAAGADRHVVLHLIGRDVVEPPPGVQDGDLQAVEWMSIAERVEGRLAAGVGDELVHRRRARADRGERLVEHLREGTVRPVDLELVIVSIQPVMREVIGAVEDLHAFVPARSEPDGADARRGHARHDRAERRMLARDGGPLGEAVVGVPEHRDLPVGPRLGDDPLDRVVAVVHLVNVRCRGALRPELPAHVLDDERVTAIGDRRSELGHERVAAALVVGEPDQHGRQTRRVGREVDVGGEANAVADLHHDLVGASVHRRRADPHELRRHVRSSDKSAGSNDLN